jgi:hypothetical protein
MRRGTDGEHEPGEREVVGRQPAVPHAHGQCDTSSPPRTAERSPDERADAG